MKISIKTKKCLRELQRDMIKIFIATARGIDSFDLLKDIDYDGIVIDSGMKVFYNDNLFKKNRLKKVDLCEFIQKIDLKKVCLCICKYDPSLKLESVQKIQSQKELPDVFDKMYIQNVNMSYVDSIQEKLSDKYYILSTKDLYHFLLPHGVSKYNGILELAKHAGIQMGEIMAFGDDLPDVELLLACGVGIAMGNSCELAKKEADFVTKSNDKEGVAFCLNWLKKEIILRNFFLIANNILILNVQKVFLFLEVLSAIGVEFRAIKVVSTIPLSASKSTCGFLMIDSNQLLLVDLV